MCIRDRYRVWEAFTFTFYLEKSPLNGRPSVLFFISEATKTTRQPVDANCSPSAPRSSTVDNRSGSLGAEPGTETADQSSSPLHQRRGSLDWTTLEAAAKKSSTSASTGGDATGKLLQITETLGVVRHSVQQAR